MTSKKIVVRKIIKSIMDSSKQKHKRHHTATPTTTPTAIVHHLTPTPTAIVHHHTPTPTAIVHHHTPTPTAHFTRPNDEDPLPPLPSNDSYVLIGEDPLPVNQTMSLATVVPDSVHSGYNLTPFVFALPFIVLGAWIAQTKVRRHGYAPIRTVEISTSEV